MSEIIKANELRVGNVFACYDSIIKVESINKDYVEGLPNDGHYLISDLEPIPLTEEWLLKFGATHFAGRVYHLDMYKIAIFDDGAVLILGSMLSNKISIGKYVHQLQNLYFALTNEELYGLPW